MTGLRFAWDPAKAAANHRKHGVTFAEAATPFADEHGLLVHDPEHSVEEDRFVLLATSTVLRPLVVLHVHDERADLIRIIPARKATRAERSAYGERRRE